MEALIVEFPAAVLVRLPIGNPRRRRTGVIRSSRDIQ
jgi:hypothetical protein